MKKISVFLASAISSILLLCSCVCATGSSSLVLASSTKSTSLKIYPDAIGDIFSNSQIEHLASKMSDVSDATDFNIMIVITDDIGPDKSDNAVIEYADRCYEERFGAYSSGIILLINNDTKYDWISGFGDCGDYISDERIDYIFDYIYDELVDEDFYYASLNFLDRVENYYYQGVDSSSSGFNLTADEKTFFIVWAIAFVILLIIVAKLIYSCSYKSYTKLKAYPKTSYSSANNVVYTESSSNYTGTYYVTVKSSSSSSSRSGSRSRSSGGRRSGGGRRR